MTREQVGWVRYDGDEYHDFRYSAPDDKRGTAMSIAADFLPVYVYVAEPPNPNEAHRYVADVTACLICGRPQQATLHQFDDILDEIEARDGSPMTERVVRPDPVIVTRDSWANAMVPAVIALIAGLIVLLLVVLS